MTLSLSLKSILEYIYANSALTSILYPDDIKSVPALLHRDHAPALERIARNAFSQIAIALLPHLESTDIADGSSDILSLTFKPTSLADDTIAPVMLTHMESAMVYYILHLCHIGGDHDRATAYEALAKETIDTISSLASGHSARPGSITRHWI